MVMVTALPGRCLCSEKFGGEEAQCRSASFHQVFERLALYRQDCSQLLEKQFSLASILSRGRHSKSCGDSEADLFSCLAGLAAEKEELARQSEVKQKKKADGSHVYSLVRVSWLSNLSAV